MWRPDVPLWKWHMVESIVPMPKYIQWLSPTLAVRVVCCKQLANCYQWQHLCHCMFQLSFLLLALLSDCWTCFITIVNIFEKDIVFTNNSSKLIIEGENVLSADIFYSCSFDCFTPPDLELRMSSHEDSCPSGTDRFEKFSGCTCPALSDFLCYFLHVRVRDWIPCCSGLWNPIY